MRKMGHAAGEGLGKLSKGILELRDWNHSTPPPPRGGLGYVPKKDKSKPKPQVICFNDPSIPAGREPSRTCFTFAHIKTHPAKPPQLQLLEVTPKGHVRKTNNYINLPDAHIHQVVSWGSAVLGPAEFTYPHPKGWVIHLRDKSYDLTQLTVKVLTASFRSHLEVTPTCISSWNSRLPRRIPWDSLGPLIHSQLTTTKDVHSWFKCILHRAMAVRKIFPREGNTHCRLCDCAVENIVHFTECTQLRSTFAPFTELLTNFGIAGPFDAATLLMGCVHASDNESYTTIPKSLFSLLLVLWKFIILMLTQVDTCNILQILPGASLETHTYSLRRTMQRASLLTPQQNPTGDQPRLPPSELVEAHSHPGADCTSREGRQVHLLTALH